MRFNTQDERFMLMAVEQAKRCVSERERDPKVGAVLVKHGQEIVKSFRGEYPDGPGDHAEYILFHKKLKDMSDAHGATLYVTLEPCTLRGHPKETCVEHVIKSGVSRVVIGCLDPNPAILNKGLRALEQAKIEVEIAPSRLRNILNEINSLFISYYNPSAEALIKRYLAGTPTVEDLSNEELGKVMLLKRYNEVIYHFDTRKVFALRLLGASDEYYTKDEVHFEEFSTDEYKYPKELIHLRSFVLENLIDEKKALDIPFFDGPCVRW